MRKTDPQVVEAPTQTPYSTCMDVLPHISCIMPTYNRREYVPRAIHYFLRQDYLNCELIVVDDGSDAVRDLMPSHAAIRYIRLNTRQSVGAKRNIACEAARGAIIAHWDDDDWHAAHRLSYQVATLTDSIDVCGLVTLLFYEPSANRAWQYSYQDTSRHWLSGSTLCYRREFWQAHPFEDINIGEDARFVWQAQRQRIAVLPEIDFHIGIIHAHNVSPKQRSKPYWSALPVEHIRSVMQADWEAFHTPSSHLATIHRTASSSQGVSNMTRATVEATHSIPPMTVAKKSDLRLREFVAVNHGNALPHMRRWEIPFALFNAQLDNTMAVLNYTINPVGFEPLLKRLYPHTYYRQWIPIQDGKFTLVRGVPDAAFDRVVCINTLEHLLPSQRDALVADMARKLKPGGRLILTADYYFDSAWEDPAFLKSGLLRADHAEVFNGFNKVTFQALHALCAAHGLHAMGDLPDDPQPDDPDLYLNTAPYVHAGVGGVFGKPAEVVPMTTDKVVILALLTWNTREISVEAVRAYAQEARMLKRLGQQPILCIVDNGSNDGTPDALRALQPELEDLIVHFIFNENNLGNCISRNQIIDYALEQKADYVLFMDGDIEIVPFSSFAMLRYMEAQGHAVGCLGADSRWQTPDRQRVSPTWGSIADDSIHTTNLVAWTQYGLFRCAMFEAGVRFDVTTPFDQPGWGFEDNDLAFQMESKGFLNCYFSGMMYLHRALHSSINILRQHGYDPTALWKRRQHYVIDKWTPVPLISNGPLVEVRRIQLQL